MATAIDAEVKRFNAGLEKFIARNPGRVSDIQRKIVFDTLAGVVEKTPVDRGHARANWQVSIGAPITSVIDAVDKDGTSTVSLGNGVAANIPPFDIVWLTNNVPYIEVLENGTFEPPDPGPTKDKRESRHGKIVVAGGFSVQAPEGMVKVTLAEILSEFA